MASELKPRPCSASEVIMTQLVLPPDTNVHGTLFGGRVLQWVDIAAAIAAHRHCRDKVVTASFDDMHFAVPIRLGDIVILKGKVNYAHRSSMEVGVRVERECPTTGERIHAATAFVTYVGIDETGRPQTVPHVAPETAEDLRRLDDAKLRRSLRLQRRQAFAARSQRTKPA